MLAILQTTWRRSNVWQLAAVAMEDTIRGAVAMVGAVGASS